MADEIDNTPLTIDRDGLVRIQRKDGSTQPLFRLDSKKNRILVWDKKSKSECALPAQKVGNIVIIDLSNAENLDLLIGDS